jgi:glycine cleavage system aminomethyltransferase T
MVKLDDPAKGDFIGRDAAAAAKAAGAQRKLVTFEMDAGTGTTRRTESAPIWHSGPDGNAVVAG